MAKSNPSPDFTHGSLSINVTQILAEEEFLQRERRARLVDLLRASRRLEDLSYDEELAALTLTARLKVTIALTDSDLAHQLLAMFKLDKNQVRFTATGGEQGGYHFYLISPHSNWHYELPVTNLSEITNVH